VVGFLAPSATTFRWATFSTGYCNCAIQDGIQDGHIGFVSTLNKNTRAVFSYNSVESNVNWFSFFKLQIFVETFYEIIKKMFRYTSLCNLTVQDYSKILSCAVISFFLVTQSKLNPFHKFLTGSFLRNHDINLLKIIYLTTL